MKTLMHRFFCLILCGVLLLGMLPPTAARAEDVMASGVCGQTMTWTLDYNGKLTFQGSGIMNMPATNGENWHYYGNYITSVVVPEGVTTIDDKAFSGLMQCTRIQLPNSVTSIGMRAFSFCTALTELTLPYNLKEIGSYAFEACEALKELRIPKAVTSIGDGAFSGCNALSQITLPDGITRIGKFTFQNCSSLETVTIPDSVTSLGEYVFNGCSSLTGVTIPKGVTTLGVGSFYECTSLTEFDIPEGITSAGQYLFTGCTNLERVSFPKGFTFIPNAAFSGCTALKEVVIPEGVTSIREHAFDGCSSLTTVALPESLTHLAPYAFSSCSSLTGVNFPKSLHTIEDHTFWNCTGLTELTVPSHIWSIRDGAFSGCSALQEIRFLGDSLYIASDAFSGVTAAAHYPDGNNTWTEFKRQNYGGTLTWTPDSQSAAPEAPNISVSTDSVSGKPTITWDAVPSADLYRIYRSSSKGGANIRIKSTSSLSYTDVDAAAGTRYYYKVKAVNSKNTKVSGYSNTASRLCVLAQPEVSISGSSSSGKPIVKWDTVEGAEKYFIYRSTKKTSGYTRVKTAVSARSYTDTDAKAGTTYYYKVKAIHENTDANSGYSEVVRRVCDLKRPSVTITRTSGGNPYLKWGDISGAKCYRVYRALSRTGTYKYLDSTTAEKYIDKDVVTGKVYYYKVRAVHAKDSANSAYSAIKYISAK